MFFDASAVDTSIISDSNAIPAGDYKVTIDGMTVKATKSGTGRYIAATFTVVSGTHQGRKVFTNFNIENENEKAEQIGKAQFASMLKAVGVEKLESEEQLYGLTDRALMIRATVKRDERFGDKNEVKKFWSPTETVMAPVARSVMNADDLPF